MSTKVLVLGANGVLGSQILSQLSNNPEVNLSATFRTSPKVKLNSKVQTIFFEVNDIFTQPDVIQAKNFDVVINCIGAIKQKGYSQVDMFAINSILPKLLARKVENTDTKILHFTTDCVYKGETEALLHENRKHDALDVYGLSKSLGEIQQENVFNIRTSFVGPEQDSNYSLLSWFTSQERNAVINGFSRQYWNGIGSLQYSKIIEAIILRSNFSFPNNIHLLPRDYVSKYELLLLFRDYFDREDVKIVRNDHEDFIYRVLSTSYPEINASLWRLAGYTEIPTIEFMVRELSDAVSS